MVLGIERFREWFRGYEDHYAIIGGTACDLLMAEEGLAFRGTKDIDLVLIVEAISLEFGRRFWEFVRNAGYEHCNKSTGQPQFYRFTHPKASEYPFMIELFSRKVDAIELPEEAVLTPLPMDEDVSSLSAILLDEDYYQLLRSGTVIVDGVTVLGAAYLIPFKAKAWLDLTARKANGENVTCVYNTTENTAAAIIQYMSSTLRLRFHPAPPPAGILHGFLFLSPLHF